MLASPLAWWWPSALVHCPAAVSRSFPAAVNAQTAIAIRQASG